MKRFWISLLAAVLLVSGWPVRLAMAAEAYYEYRETTRLAKGVVYEQNRQMTEAGMLDIHILKVPLNDPYLYIGPVESQKELGLKETAAQLLAGANAIAGTNGDFFGMAGTYSVPFGPVVSDGVLKSVSTDTNAKKNEFAALFLDDTNHPFMKYMKSDIYFMTNNTAQIEISAYNKVGHDFEWPVIVDRRYMTDTAGLDKRFPGLLKVVADGGAITYISYKGESVEVPENGYVLVIPARMADSYSYRFSLGQKAELIMTNSLYLDFNKIKTAIGGGGLLLSAGQTVHDQGTAIAGRQPRTAVGVTQDGQYLILMAVDGRTHSIGATHNEMAALMSKYGAYDAMHLDGGGSTTMVIKEPETGAYDVVNTVSEGAERRVINALGIFDRSPVGEINKLGLRMSQPATFTGTPVTVEAYGEDKYLHKITLPDNYPYTLDFIGLNGDTGAGAWINKNTFMPYRAGLFTLRVLVDGKPVAQQVLRAYDLAELQCNTTAIRTVEGMTTPLSFSGIAVTGVQSAIDGGVTVNVVPPQLGTVADGVFTAVMAGSGYLDASLNGIHTYIPLTVGGRAVSQGVFNGAGLSSFSGYPASVTGGVRTESTETRPITRLDYQFIATSDTQAAYVDMYPTVTTESGALALRMNVYGDGSGNWLRGRVKDVNGQYYNVDFARTVDFTGWQSVTALLPEPSRAPYTLERVYMAAVACESEQNNTVWFDRLEILYASNLTPFVPEGQKFYDPLRADLSALVNGEPGTEGLLDVILAPANKAYSFSQTGNTAIFTLMAAKGGLYAANTKQWQQLTQDLRNLNAQYVILLMDADPFAFSQPKESELLHKMLTEQQYYARTVFVVSAVGPSSEPPRVTLKDGIRYISLPRPTEGENAHIRFLQGVDEIRFDTGL